MLFRTITKENFKKMVEGLMEENEVIGPKSRDRDKEGNKIYRFLKLYSFDELEMDYTRSYSSPKNYFLPFKEDLATYRLEDKGWDQKIHYTIHQRIIIGMRACDINALSHALASAWAIERALKIEVPEPAHLLHPKAKETAEALNFRLGEHNPFFYNLAQLVECFHVMYESKEIILRLIDSDISEFASHYRVKECEGVGAVEAPRGILYHYYGIGEDGKIEKSDCVIPTSQNHVNIYYDLHKLVEELIEQGKGEEEIRDLSQMLVRAYDPCISCSVH